MKKPTRKSPGRSSCISGGLRPPSDAHRAPRQASGLATAVPSNFCGEAAPIKLQPLVAKISSAKNLVILDSCKDPLPPQHFASF